MANCSARDQMFFPLPHHHPLWWAYGLREKGFVVEGGSVYEVVVDVYLIIFILNGVLVSFGVFVRY